MAAEVPDELASVFSRRRCRGKRWWRCFFFYLSFQSELDSSFSKRSLLSSNYLFELVIEALTGVRLVELRGPGGATPVDVDAGGHWRVSRRRNWRRRRAGFFFVVLLSFFRWASLSRSLFSRPLLRPQTDVKEEQGGSKKLKRAQEELLNFLNGEEEEKRKKGVNSKARALSFFFLFARSMTSATEAMAVECRFFSHSSKRQQQ